MAPEPNILAPEPTRSQRSGSEERSGAGARSQRFLTERSGASNFRSGARSQEEQLGANFEDPYLKPLFGWLVLGWLVGSGLVLRKIHAACVLLYR